MVSYTGALVDLVVDTTKTGIDYNLSYIPTELTTEGVTPIYATVSCIAAEQPPIIAAFQATIVGSLIGMLLDTYSGSIVHHPVDHLYSYPAAELYVLYGLPASVFGYIRTVHIEHLGQPLPFMSTVLDGALPTGLLTNNLGVSLAAFQKLTYTTKGQRSHQEFMGDLLDYTGLIPNPVTVTVRRRISAKLNRNKIR